MKQKDTRILELSNNSILGNGSNLLLRIPFNNVVVVTDVVVSLTSGPHIPPFLGHLTLPVIREQDHLGDVVRCALTDRGMTQTKGGGTRKQPETNLNNQQLNKESTKHDINKEINKEIHKETKYT